MGSNISQENSKKSSKKIGFKLYGRLNNHLKSLTNLLAVAEFHGLNLCIPQQLHHELSKVKFRSSQFVSC